MTTPDAVDKGILMKTIVYPISANPPTWGHADIMQRAAKAFDHVFWVAAINPNKMNPDFTDEERAQMMQAYVEYFKLGNVTVDTHSGTIVRYAKEKKAGFLLRGLRNTTDFQYELEMAAGNRGIHKNIETVSMFSKPHFATISSSLVRELAILGERIDQYVLRSQADFIAEKLRKKNLGKKP